MIDKPVWIKDWEPTASSLDERPSTYTITDHSACTCNSTGEPLCRADVHEFIMDEYSRQRPEQPRKRHTHDSELPTSRRNEALG